MQMQRNSLGQGIGRLIAIAVAAAMLLMTASAQALEKIRLGKSVPHPFTFTPAEIGTETGIWKKHGLEIEVFGYGGDAKMQQGLASNAIDMSLGSGPGMGFMAKGIPAKAVAAFADAPLSMGLIIGSKSPVKKLADLKGAKIGVSTNASLTYWLTRELSRRQGWGPDGIQTVPLGRLPGNIAAMKRGQVDGFVMSASVGYRLEKTGDAYVLLSFGDFIKDFHTHVVFATNKMIAERPDQIRAFLKAWIEVIEFMRKNKDGTLRISSKITKLPPDLASREYDAIMPMMTTDLKFDAPAVKTLLKSFVELGILPTEPDPKVLYTEEFIPASR
ncbi:MAG: hypothetical protein A3G25_03390 [Betaproteobacteria bacterium RIFCSPLOWO2_12_FULL_63_13]|nr:MAG: hypothetical protein A3G25_03390 [Betaproteobacteria bacterium RIFCSPLOWO2_12_FULL_63_13]